MTAKIVLMDGASTDRIEATFYTPGEFERVLSASRKNPHAQTELSDAREAARTAGVREPDVLTEPAHVESAGQPAGGHAIRRRAQQGRRLQRRTSTRSSCTPIDLGYIR